MPRIAALLGMCAICLGATSGSCSFFGIGRADSDITVDLATERAADPLIAQVVVPLVGLEFRTDAGSTETLTFRDTELIDLMDHIGVRTPLRVFTDENLPEGTYTGMRLLFDDEDEDAAFVLDNAGREFPVEIDQGDFAPLDFTAGEGERDDAWTLSLDLRQSLGLNDAEDGYELRPVLRSVRTEEAGRIEGIVTATCVSGGLLSNGAVYLFQEENVQPDDRDGSGVEPYATAPLRTDQVAGPFRYTLRFLPEGRYTIALTCRGHEEHPAEDDDLRFQNVRNVRVDSETTRVHDIE